MGHLAHINFCPVAGQDFESLGCVGFPLPKINMFFSIGIPIVVTADLTGVLDF